MAITNEQQQNIIALTVGLFNAAPGAQYLTELSEVFEANGNSYAALTDFIVSTPAFNAQYAGRVTVENQVATALNLLGVPAEGEAREEATAYFLERAEAGASEAEILLEAVQFLQGDVAPKYADIKAAFANKIEVATYFSVEKQQSNTDIATLKQVVSSVTADEATVEAAKTAIDSGAISPDQDGQTFTLTTGADDLMGTSGNDTFRAFEGTTSAGTAPTLTSADIIDGGAGFDTLAIRDIAALANNAAPVIRNVERIDNSSTNVLNLTDVTGLQQLWSLDEGSYTNANLDLIFGAQGVDGTITIGLEAGTDLSDSGDELNLAVANVADNTDSVAYELNAADGTTDLRGEVESVNLTTAGADAGTVDLSGFTGLEELTVTGEADVTVTLDDAADDLATVDASGNSGDVTVDVSEIDGIETVTTGAGADTVTIAATDDLVVNTGAGRDTIIATDGLGAAAEITGGAGADTYELGTSANISDARESEFAADIAKIVGFNGDQDKLDFSNLTVISDNVRAEEIADAESLFAAVTMVASDQTATGDVAFVYGESTYIFSNVLDTQATPAANTFNAGDGLVELVGFTGAFNESNSDFTA